MSLLFTLIAHFLVTLARLAGRGGLGAVAAESLAVKHQLVIMKRARRRPPRGRGYETSSADYIALDGEYDAELAEAVAFGVFSKDG